MWASGSFEIKQGLKNLIFPEGISCDFQNNTYRTCKLNSVFSSISDHATVFALYEDSGNPFLGYNSALVVLSPQLSNFKQNDILNAHSFIERYQQQIQNI